jgi:hypothetical protein
VQSGFISSWAIQKLIMRRIIPIWVTYIMKRLSADRQQDFHTVLACSFGSVEGVTFIFDTYETAQKKVAAILVKLEAYPLRVA